MKKILIIEDDPMVAMINSEYISQFNGVQIVGQGSSEADTLFYLEKYDVDVILMDVYLGNENGIDILQKIRSLGYTTDVIMITSANGSQDIKKALALGCIDYLIKPFDFDRFKLSIDKIFQRDELLKDDKIDQHTLDSINTNDNISYDDLPKGLNENTLKRIISVIKGIKIMEFGIKDICEPANLSNVTVKKYLDYLESIRYINSFSIYGNVGRPLYMYRKTGKL